MDGDATFYDGAGGYDRETVRFFDVAHEGAQVRAVAQCATRLERLRGMAPRSLVVLATDQVSEAAARALARLREPLRLPVVVTSALPGYVGPLDVVVVAGEANDESAARALATAAGRGAETVLAGPARGPLVDDAPDATLVVPALPTTAGPSALRTFAAVGAVLSALEQPAEFTEDRLRALADEVDRDLESLSPERDETVNAARQLRAFSSGARVVHSGADRCGLTVARVAAEVWSTRGIPSAYVGQAELPAALEDAGDAGAPGDIFRDPFLDGPPAEAPVRTIVWNAGATGAPRARAEACEPSALGEEGTAARLIVRAAAATAMEPDPA